MTTQVTVVTCSDRAYEDAAEDRAGTVLREGLAERGFDVASAIVVPLETSAIQGAIVKAVEAGSRIVMTTGGTGLLPRDVTVEATEALLDYPVPGLMEEVRRLGAEKTLLSLLSRGTAGVVSVAGHPRALVVNAPGSRGGARDTLAVVGPLLDRIVDSLDGADHDLSRPASS